MGTIRDILIDIIIIIVAIAVLIISFIAINRIEKSCKELEGIDINKCHIIYE